MPGTLVAADVGKFTREFPLEACTFKSTSKNPYFILKPGRQLHFSNARCVARGDCDELEVNVITVLYEERDITFRADDRMMTVRARVVEERETAAGQLKEVSRNFFAECAGTQDVYYFGEDVDNYENGVIVNHDGAWMAGRNRAKPGIIIPGGAFLLGARYYQEVAPGVALDRGEHVAMDLDVRVPAGRFDDCVKVNETSPLEPGSVSTKIYCPGTGLVTDDELELEFVVE
jgi:hypothetical protein